MSHLRDRCWFIFALGAVPSTARYISLQRWFQNSQKQPLKIHKSGRQTHANEPLGMNCSLPTGCAKPATKNVTFHWQFPSDLSHQFNYRHAMNRAASQQIRRAAIESGERAGIPQLCGPSQAAGNEPRSGRKPSDALFKAIGGVRLALSTAVRSSEDMLCPCQ